MLNFDYLKEIPGLEDLHRLCDLQVEGVTFRVIGVLAEGVTFRIVCILAGGQFCRGEGLCGQGAAHGFC